MPQTAFDRDAMAKWYAREHLKTDPGIHSIYYLPKNAPEREIRLVEVNELIGERLDDAIEPIDFGVDTGMGSAHKLFVLDVTPGQWERIEKRILPLPPGWSLEDSVPYDENAR